MTQLPKDALQYMADNLAVIATDNKGCVTAFNEGAEHISGYLCDEILNQAVPIPNFADIKTRLNEHKEQLIDTHICHKQGQLISVNVTASTIEGDQGDTNGYLLMLNSNKPAIENFDILQLHDSDIFERVLEREFRRMQRHQQPIALIKIDMDSYKSYLAAYGQDATTRCIGQIGYTLNSRIQRAGDFMAYMGHDEFMVLLPNTDLPGVVKMAEYVRLLIASLEIPHPSSAANIATISLGIGHMIPDKMEEPNHLLAIADQGLRQAKADGRNCSRIGTPQN